MGKNLNLRQKAETILAKYDEDTKDALYRAVWFDRVCDDIRAYEKDEMDLDTPLTDEQVEYAAERYVYDGEYDCNQSYWCNIGSVIKPALQFAK